MSAQLALVEMDALREGRLEFVRDCDRNTADKILGGKADGTFLIRPSSQVDCYALSVV